MPSDTSSIGNLSSIYKNIPTVITLKVNHICNNGSISSIQKLPLLGTILTAVGKIKQAFSNGFIGLPSFGYSTLVNIVNVKEEDLSYLRESLGKHFVINCGAPSKDIAEKAADDEINFMIDLCKSHELGSLLSVSREWSDEGIKEKFRNLPKADSCAEQKIWTFVEDD